MWPVLLTIVAVLLPLSRMLPPLYDFRIRSRIFRWYRQLREVETAIGKRPNDELLRELEAIEQRVEKVTVPLSYADELYALRTHIQMVAERLIDPRRRSAPRRRRDAARDAAARPGRSAAASAASRRCARCRRRRSRSPSSTAPTTTCSSRCSTRSRPPGLSAPAVSAPIRHVLRADEARQPDDPEGRGAADRRRRRAASALDGGERDRLGPPDRRRRRDAQLLRPRRLGAACAGAEDAGRRVRHPRPRDRRLRAAPSAPPTRPSATPG